MLTTETRINPWKAIYGASRSLACLPLARRVAAISWVNVLRMWLAERSVSGRPERVYLEREILPVLMANGYQRALFVGCRRYTAHYGPIFKASGVEYWTMDIDPKARRWGDPERHVVGDVCVAERHLPIRGFDLVLLNGVFGFGVDDDASMGRALEAVHAVMKPGGVLLVGWNEGLIRDPAVLAEMQARFTPDAPPPLPWRKVFADDVHHVYDFYRAL
jgi:SAM-dependent methyltransferase